MTGYGLRLQQPPGALTAGRRTSKTRASGLQRAVTPLSTNCTHSTGLSGARLRDVGRQGDSVVAQSLLFSTAMNPFDLLADVRGSPPAADRRSPQVRDVSSERSRFAIASVVLAHPLRMAGLVARRLRSAWSRRSVRLALATLAALVVLPPAWAVYHVYFDRSGLPDIEPFLRFEPPRIGEVYDARGKVLIELAREYRRVVSYDEVPFVLRQAVLAAEDKNFFSHSGVDYSALPRVVRRTTVQVPGRVVERRQAPSAAPAGRLDAHAAARPRLLPPGADESSRTATLSSTTACPSASSPRPWVCPPRTSCFGSWRRCAWRSGSRRRCNGATERRSRPSVRSSRARPASTTWATAATAWPPPPSTTSASPCRATRSRTRARRHCWRVSASRPGTTPRRPAIRGPCAAATRSWP